jgi:N-acetyl-anhydromuramyl-L-alanine amidase AmpD
MKRPKSTHIVIHRAEVWGTKEYHFVVLRDGTVEYCVPIDDKAEHAFKANSYGIAVAFQGCFTSGIKAKYNIPTEAQYARGKELVAWLRGLYGDLKVVRHSDLGLDGTRYPEKLIWEQSCPGDLFDMDKLL